MNLINKSKNFLTSLIILFSLKVYGENLINITAEDFLKENYSWEREKIIKHLITQFKDKKINLEQVNKLWNNEKLRTTYMMARFQIIDQKLYTDAFSTKLNERSYFHTGYNYYYMLATFFSKFVKKYKVPNVDFIVYLRETIPYESGMAEETLSIPAFIMFKDNKNKYEVDKLIFPDPFFLKRYWHGLLYKIAMARDKVKWEEKEKQIFWRGGSTGDFLEYNFTNIDKLPRLKISLLSSIYPNLIDAKIVEYVGIQFPNNKKGKSLKKVLELISETKLNKVNEEDHLKYKYLLSLDGNSATGMRVPWIMYSDSALIKQESSKIEWFYSALKPYYNYIPLKSDLSDIFEILGWMKNNDDKLQEISNKAHSFVENNLKEEQIDAHVAILLNEYAKIQQDKEITPTLPIFSDSTLFKNAFKMFVEKYKDKFFDWIESWN